MDVEDEIRDIWNRLDNLENVINTLINRVENILWNLEKMAREA